MINLSERLYAAAKLAGESAIFADVGCDHGYLGLYLLEEGMTQKVYAMDVNEGPLMRARENADAAGFGDKAEFILSDGLKEEPQPYADTVAILGMGRALILKIIKEAPEFAKSAVKKYVLGPQSEQEQFRRNLTELNLVITRESHVLEDGKYYPVMLAEPLKAVGRDGSKAYELRNLAEFAYGRLGLERKDEVLKKHIEKDREIFSQLLTGWLPENRRRHIKERYETTLEALKVYYENDA